MVRCACTLAITLVFNSGLLGADRAPVPVFRWTAGASNCSLRRGDDGRTYYGISSAGFDITLSVDPKELEKIPHRATPMLGVLLSFTRKGAGNFEIRQRRISLEFVNHRQVVKTSLDPDEIVQHLQDDVDALTDQVERHDIRKHPEQREQKEAELQARLKDYTEMIDFVSTQSLHHAVLNSGDPSIKGWVFFSVKDRWIGPWHKPEQFILRVPAGDQILEFAFSLPPKNNEVELRKRPQAENQ